MRNQEQEKDFYLIAKKLKNKQQTTITLQAELQERYNKESQQALKMINAYRKVENLKSNQSHQRNFNSNNQKNQTKTTIQPKSSYAVKIKQTLRQLNANKARQYEKIAQKNAQLSSTKNIKELQVVNQMETKVKTQNQKKLIIKATQKIWNLFLLIKKRIYKQSLSLILKSSEQNLLEDYKMAIRYRTFRIFCLWREKIKILKIENEKRRKQQSQKQIQGEQLSYEFYVFKTCKKVMKNWARLTINEKKRRKYEEEMSKIEKQQKKHKGQQNIKKVVTQSESDQLQSKLKGFLHGLKEKIESKDLKANLHPIQEKEEESQRQSAVYSQSQGHQDPHTEIQNQQQPNINGQHTQVQDQNPSDNSQKPLSNQQLQKKRQEIYERSKNRKQALQKLKKQKQIMRKKEQEERKQLQRKIQEEEKRIKQLKYKQFQQRKRLERQWEQRQIQLNDKAENWNRLRILKYYGFNHWKNLKTLTISNAIKLELIVTKIMIRHAGSQLIENLIENQEKVIGKMYQKMELIYRKKLKSKVIKGLKLQRQECLQQKIHLQAFHEVHTLKVFLSQWKQVMDILRLENLQQERPLIKKANDYHKVSLLLKCLRELKKNAIESKKEKNIKDQKMKIKSKIKDVIKEKIEINYEEFL